MAFAFAQHENVFFLALAEVCQQISVKSGFDQPTVSTAMLLKLVLLHSAGIFTPACQISLDKLYSNTFFYSGVQWHGLMETQKTKTKKVGEIWVDRLANFHMPN